MAETILSLRGIRRRYPGPGGVPVDILDGIDLDIEAGQTLGLVGESGCGKTTLGRAIMLLPPPDEGQVILEGTDLTTLTSRQLRAVRPRIQMVFQDPVSSLNPKRTIFESIIAPLQLHARLTRAEQTAQANAMIEAVGLDPALIGARYPHELSGGQCQRASIARALVLQPRVLVCDEPVSSLDVSIQSQILNLLLDSQRRFALTLLFIAHDIAVVRYISDRIAVMYQGQVCEVLPSATLVEQAIHPYTRLLLDSIPGQGSSDAQSANETHSTPRGVSEAGCRFRHRCPIATSRCAVETPRLREIRPGHFVACHNLD